MNKSIENILTRVSCRSYNEKKVPLSKLNIILKAGQSAPSAVNRQISKITAVRKKNLVEALRNLSNEVKGKDCMYGANTIVLVHAPRDNKFCIQDSSCILENIFLAANALKIDSCWINQFDELFETKKGQKLKAKLGIPQENMVVGSAILGYKKEGTILEIKSKENITITIK